MKKIGETIIEEGITSLNNLKERKTIRAAIFQNGKVCLLYSGLFDDYTFPGGGLKDDESHVEALKRELKEEVGANEIEVISAVGYTEEIRYGLNQNNSVYKQTSYYYLCEVNKLTKPIYIGREKEQDLKMVCLNIDEAINHNEKTNKKRNIKEYKGFTTVLKRENLVLNYLKNNFNYKVKVI